MPRVLILGRGGSINADRVIAVAHAKSEPIRRMIESTDMGKVMNLTYGYPRRSVIVLDNGFIVISSRTPEGLARALGSCEELTDEDQPPWW
jgi:regulator of extracellular matrix RemA (YlzA/DUF370 family)